MWGEGGVGKAKKRLTDGSARACLRIVNQPLMKSLRLCAVVVVEGTKHTQHEWGVLGRQA